MKTLVLVAVVVLLPVGIALGAGKQYTAQLKNASGQVVGTATLKEKKSGANTSVVLSVKVNDLAAGDHGFHIHEKGACEPPDFKSAGGHFNPAGKKHGLENPEGHHMGDLRNLTVSAKGTGKAERVIEGATLSDGPNSVVGRAVVIHEKADDNKTDPAGNAGNRIACGVIGQ